MFLIGNVLISFMFDFVQGPQGPQGVQGERGPIGEGLPGPKVGRWVLSFMLFCLFQRSLSSTFDTLDSTSYPITPKNHSAKTHSHTFPQSQVGMASEGCCRNSLEDSFSCVGHLRHLTHHIIDLLQQQHLVFWYFFSQRGGSVFLSIRHSLRGKGRGWWRCHLFFPFLFFTPFLPGRLDRRLVPLLLRHSSHDVHRQAADNWSSALISQFSTSSAPPLAYANRRRVYSYEEIQTFIRGRRELMKLSAFNSVPRSAKISRGNFFQNHACRSAVLFSSHSVVMDYAADSSFSCFAALLDPPQSR